MNKTIGAVKERYFLLAILIVVGLFGCTKEDDAEPESDVFIACNVDGKSLSNSEPSSFYSTVSSSMGLLTTLEVSKAEGYLLEITVLNPKIGTFTGKTGAVYGTVRHLTNITSSNPGVQSYTLLKTDQSTITITKFTPNGYAEGTFSLVGQDNTGKTTNLTGGKFKVSI